MSYVITTDNITPRPHPTLFKLVMSSISCTALPSPQLYLVFINILYYKSIKLDKFTRKPFNVNKYLTASQ